MSDLNLEGVEGFGFHYVVQFDSANRKFFVDAETTDAVFHEGQVWDGTEWHAPREGDDPFLYNLLYEIEERLAKLLDDTQK